MPLSHASVNVTLPTTTNDRRTTNLAAYLRPAVTYERPTNGCCCYDEQDDANQLLTTTPSPTRAARRSINDQPPPPSSPINDVVAVVTVVTQSNPSVNHCQRPTYAPPYQHQSVNQPHQPDPAAQPHQLHASSINQPPIINRSIDIAPSTISPGGVSMRRMIVVGGDALAAAGLADEAHRARRAGCGSRRHRRPSPCRPSRGSTSGGRGRRAGRRVPGAFGAGEAPRRGDGVATGRCQNLLRGSRASRRPSPMKLIPRTVSTMAMPGKNGHHQLPLGMNRTAPLRALPHVGLNRIHAEAEEAHERLRDDDAGDRQGGRDDQRAQRVRAGCAGR